MSFDRFVILHHLAPTGEHWDLMLERGESLLTWQLLAEPHSRDACPIAGVRISDHRKRYLDHEGPLGGGRGIVTRVDHGRYELLSADAATYAIHLSGRRLRGHFLLERIDESSSQWRLLAT